MKQLVKLAFLLLLSINSVNAQNEVNAPYSRFGLGELTANYTPTMAAMGSVSQGVFNPLVVNYNNPASYAFGYRQRFIMQTGLGHTTNRMQTLDASQITNYTNLSHFTIGFPVAKWWGTSVGILPYSDIAYSFNDNWEDPAASLFFEGSGGLSRFYMGHAFTLHKSLSIGGNLNYLFGSLNTIRKVVFEDDSYLHTRHTDQTIVSGFYYDCGAMFKTKVSDWTLSTSVTLDNGGDVSAKKTVLSETFRFNNLIETVEDTFAYSSTKNGSVVLPSGFAAGFSFSNDQWLIAADYTTKNWSEFSNFGVSDNLDNSSRYAFGLEFTPDRKAINKYFQMVRYRLGAYTSNTYLNLRGQHLEEKVVSFGFGLPMKRSGTLLNLSAELGQRGTTQENLIQDTFARFKIGLVLSDIWFIKRKYD
ncbi:MAG: hypothetical protein CMP66_05905 [Flavobacteriales bacterium]|nr:hypothetical protein [Flavobacteriales bacterium]|tara:strand:- start:12629 stop:13879 length:1251 start_codon:yes stop_codon:yes gene_type:complete